MQNSLEGIVTKLQVYGSGALFTLEGDIEREEKNRLFKYEDAKLSLLTLHPKKIKDAQGKFINCIMKDMYKKIVGLLLIASDMNAKTDMKDVREVSAALESIFPMSEVKTFVTSPRAQKERSIEKWRLLIIGIRLFNREMNKGGDTIPRSKATKN